MTTVHPVSDSGINTAIELVAEPAIQSLHDRAQHQIHSAQDGRADLESHTAKKLRNPIVLRAPPECAPARAYQRKYHRSLTGDQPVQDAEKNVPDRRPHPEYAKV